MRSDLGVVLRDFHSIDGSVIDVTDDAEIIRLVAGHMVARRLKRIKGLSKRSAAYQLEAARLEILQRAAGKEPLPVIESPKKVAIAKPELRKQEVLALQ